MKRLPIFALIFIFGTVVGFAGCWLYFKKMVEESVARSLDAMQSVLYSYETQEAENQFTNRNRDIAIYALDRAVKHLDDFQKPRMSTCRRTAYSLGRFNVRLATLYGEAGNLKARENHLKQAVASYETMGWKLKDITELQEATPLIESGKLPEALKAYGELTTPCDMK